MPKHLLVAMTNPLPGKDAEFNDWYDNVAYPTYKALPGLVPLGRFKAADVPPLFPFQMENTFVYLSLYYFEADDPVSFMQELKAAFALHPQYHFSDTIDQSHFFEPIFVALGDVNFSLIDQYQDLKR